MLLLYHAHLLHQVSYQVVVDLLAANAIIDQNGSLYKKRQYSSALKVHKLIDNKYIKDKDYEFEPKLYNQLDIEKNTSKFYKEHDKNCGLTPFIPNLLMRLVFLGMIYFYAANYRLAGYLIFQ